MLKVSSIVILAGFMAVIYFTQQPYFDRARGKPAGAEKNSIALVPVKFEDQTLDWGLTASHGQSGHKLTGLNEVMGGGACIFDFNNDGWQDVFIVGGSGQHRYYGKTAWWAKAHGDSLWQNTGNSSFIDVTRKSNIPAIEWSMGCATGDLNNDGNTDLIVLTIGKNRVLKNNGDETFSDVTDKTGLQLDDAWSLSASIADYNDDGLVDIYVGNFIHYAKQAKVYERTSGFLDPVDAAFDPVLYDSQANKLYENSGDFVFIEKSSDMAVANITGRSKATRWLDVNQDQKADLLVLNSGGSPNQLYLNRWPEPFYSESSLYRVESSAGSNNLAVGDIDNDQDVDILITRSAATAPMLLVNNLNKDRRDGIVEYQGLKDLAWELGLAHDAVLYQEGWGLSLADLNNDGWMDLYSANGLLSIDEDSGHVAVGQQDQIWLNNAGVFELQPQTDFLSLPGRSVVAGDFNNDGKNDLVVTHNNGDVRLLINTTASENAWLSVDLKDKNGAVENAVASVQADGINLTRAAFSESGFLSQAGHRLHFGLGGAKRVELVKVIWGDGVEQIFNDVKINSIIGIEKGVNQVEYNTSRIAPIKFQLPDYYPYLNPDEKKIFVEAVHAARQNPLAIDILMHTFSDKESLIRLISLELMSDTKAKVAYLSLLKKAMTDEALAVRLKAIEHVKMLELEQSVDWLIAALSDPKSSVQCKAADTLAHFYREEEAVIYRKYLAVPHLVRSLQHADPRVKICVAKALAEAERYRPVNSLLSLIHDVDEMVQNQAISALGFLRDTRAIEPLVSMLQSRTASVATTAHALVALKRLNYSGLDKLLQYFYNPDKAQRENIKSLEIFDALLVLEEGIVFDTADIRQYRAGLLENICQANLRPQRCNQPEVNERLLAEPGSLAANEFTRWASGLGIKTNKVLTDIIKNKSEDVNRRLDAMQFLAEKNIEYVKILLLRYVANENNELRHKFIPLFSHYDEFKEVRDYLWSILKDQRHSFELRFQSAKVLAPNEPFEVIDQLTGLTWTNPPINQ